ncbi:MAG TPA: histidine phosphatase family protein [Kofleriaceae bacterium]|nr:histidine phosphatase family protein [Kofleriaceae bacterium]
MHLYVVRHATAEDAAPGEPDASRRLTAAGERKFRRAVQGLRQLDWRFARVLASPWSRAHRTAELLEPVSETDPIATDLLCQSPSLTLLALIAEADRTAVVGHEPWLGELIAWLVFGDAKHGDAIALKKGSVAWLEGSAAPGGMKLRAIVPPKVLRSLR